MDISITLNFADAKEEELLETLTQLAKITSKLPKNEEVKPEQPKKQKLRAEPVEEEPAKTENQKTTEPAEKTLFEKISDLLRTLLTTHKSEVFTQLATYECATVKDLTDDDMEDFYKFLITLESGEADE